MVEMPSDLAIRAGLSLFKNESSEGHIKHTKFLEDPSEYESSVGKVYCDAGNGIYARIIKDREQAIFECNPKVAHLCTDVAISDLVEVVLYQYRSNQTEYSFQALSYLERVIEEALVAVHGADASGSANASMDTVFAWMRQWWRDGFMMPAWIDGCMNGNMCAWMCSHHLFSQY